MAMLGFAGAFEISSGKTDGQFYQALFSRDKADAKRKNSRDNLVSLFHAVCGSGGCDICSVGLVFLPESNPTRV
jgi:hypothetical protein